MATHPPAKFPNPKPCAAGQSWAMLPNTPLQAGLGHTSSPYFWIRVKPHPLFPHSPRLELGYTPSLWGSVENRPHTLTSPPVELSHTSFPCRTKASSFLLQHHIGADLPPPPTWHGLIVPTRSGPVARFGLPMDRD